MFAARKICSSRAFTGPVAVSLLLVLLPGCCREETGTRAAPSDQWYREQRLLYHGIPVDLRFAPSNDTLAAKAWAYLERVDDVFNAYRPDSEIGRINSSPGQTRVRLSDDLAEAFRLSFDAYRITGGTFDVTIRPLRKLWQDAGKKGEPPTPQEIEAALKLTGLNHVNLDGDSLTVDVPGLKFDFGGIVKGIAVDKVVTLLKERGVRSALVQVGGETAAFGTSMRGKPHVIGVQHPKDTAGLWAAVADPGTGISCSTSGNYRNPVVIGGKEYYHIVDPKTGQPVDTRTLSVSVVFRETGKNWLADALATAAAVMGPEHALETIEAQHGEALILIEQDGQIREHKSAGWDSLVHKE